jgi:tetratricopeptide (TPR) repeat protein
MENHGTSAIIWHALNIKGATLIHVDTHDDCRFLPPENIEKLKILLNRRDYAEIFRLSDQGSYFRYEVKEEDLLYDLGNYIYGCIADGTISTFYWVVPDKPFHAEARKRMQRHIQQCLRLTSLPELRDEERGVFSFRFMGTNIIVTDFDNLPTMKPGALLDFDIDFFAFPHAMSKDHLTGKLIWDPQNVCARLSKLIPDPAVISICSSVPGGFLPLMLRFIADACFEYFDKKRYPGYAARLFDKLTILRTTRDIVPLPEPPGDTCFDPAFEHLCGLILLMQGKDDEGLALIDKAARMMPVYDKGLLDISEAFIFMKKLEPAHEAIDRFVRIAGRETTSSDAARLRTYLSENNLAKADALSRKLVAWDPGSPFFLMLRGGTLTEQRKYDEALFIYTELLKISPGDGIVYYNIGVVLEKQNKPDEAINYYQNAIKLKPTFADAQENLGTLYLNRGNLEQAVKHLARTVEISPFRVTALNNLGLALFRQGAYDQAVKPLRIALQINPRLAEVHANLGACLENMGELDDAIGRYKKALELRPDWKDMENLLRKAEERRGRL